VVYTSLVFVFSLVMAQKGQKIDVIMIIKIINQTDYKCLLLNLY